MGNSQNKIHENYLKKNVDLDEFDKCGEDNENNSKNIYRKEIKQLNHNEELVTVYSLGKDIRHYKRKINSNM
tara:strand:- start:983 stop:1198 length:216 start_codon:yes stop_codon:yes gene_type:complete